jgi:hypothetical protein
MTMVSTYALKRNVRNDYFGDRDSTPLQKWNLKIVKIVTVMEDTWVVPFWVDS